MNLQRIFASGCLALSVFTFLYFASASEYIDHLKSIPPLPLGSVAPGTPRHVSVQVFATPLLLLLSGIREWRMEKRGIGVFFGYAVLVLFSLINVGEIKNIFYSDALRSAHLIFACVGAVYYGLNFRRGLRN